MPHLVTKTKRRGLAASASASPAGGPRGTRVVSWSPAASRRQSTPSRSHHHHQAGLPAAKKSSMKHVAPSRAMGTSSQPTSRLAGALITPPLMVLGGLYNAGRRPQRPQAGTAATGRSAPRRYFHQYFRRIPDVCMGLWRCAGMGAPCDCGGGRGSQGQPRLSSCTGQHSTATLRQRRRRCRRWWRREQLWGAHATTTLSRGTGQQPTASRRLPQRRLRPCWMRALACPNAVAKDGCPPCAGHAC